MAKYKVWFTVKDDYGNTKEIEGGAIEIDAGIFGFTEEEIDHLEEALPLEEYVTKMDLDEELDGYATNSAVAEAIQNTDSIRYTDFELQD